MILSLPKDVLWLIIKEYLYELLDRMNKWLLPNAKNSLHTTLFTSNRSRYGRAIFNLTYPRDEDMHFNCLHKNYFVDHLYPLRLVCKRFDNILRQKINVVTRMNYFQEPTKYLLVMQ